MKRKEAVRLSIERWEAIINEEKPHGFCGFCLYTDSKRKKRDFGKGLCEIYCPLYPDVCSYNEPLYWQWWYTRDTETAQEILNAIKERGEKWIKGDL